MPRRIVINQSFGGFNLSDLAMDVYEKRTGKSLKRYDVTRDDPDLIWVLEQIGLDAAADSFCKLKIVEIPDDVPEDGWEIMDYDGNEWVAEKHRTWN